MVQRGTTITNDIMNVMQVTHIIDTNHENGMNAKVTYIEEQMKTS